MLSDPLLVVQKAVMCFDFLDIKYLIGGSLASSLYGIPRATQDVDIVADVTVENLQALLDLLKKDFYVDPDLGNEALQSKSSFNIIDKETIFKIDIFLMSHDTLSSIEMDRRKPYSIVDSNTFFLCSPEDIIAHKLYWYKLGDEISERQWNDALNVLKIQQDTIDLEYLEKMCSARSVLSLLHKMLAQLNQKK
jgi:hypothetical protein